MDFVADAIGDSGLDATTMPASLLQSLFDMAKSSLKMKEDEAVRKLCEPEKKSNVEALGKLTKKSNLDALIKLKK